MDLNTQKDDIRKRLIKDSTQTIIKIEKLIQDIDNISQSKQTAELNTAKQRLGVLLNEYINTVEYHKNRISQSEESEEEVLDDNLNDKILAKKKFSHTEILVLQKNDDYVTLKLLPVLNLKDKHEFTFKITNTKGILSIKEYDLPNFIPSVLNVDLKTGKFETVNALIQIIVEYLEAYLLRRENVFILKEKFVPEVIKKIEYCPTFCNVTIALVLHANQEDNNLDVILHYPYKNNIADIVNITIPDAAANTSWFQSVKAEIHIFKLYPLYEAFCKFADISEESE